MAFRLEFTPPFADAATPPLSVPIVASEQLRQCAKRDGLWIVPDPGGKKIAALSVGWEYGNEDMRLGYWACSEADDTYLNSVITVLQNEKDEVDQRIADAYAQGQTPKQEDLYRSWELGKDIDDLRRHRFWMEQENALGDGCIALYRSVSAANVPWGLDSAETLVHSGRGFTLHFYRFQFARGQARKRLRFRWAQFIIEFPNDGPEAKLHVINDGLSEDEYEQYATEWELLEDKRVLNEADTLQIEQWRDQIEEIKQTAKTAGRDLTQAEQQQILSLKTQIQALKDSKGLTEDEEQRRRELERLMYRLSTGLELGLASQSSMNTHISLTVVPDPRGYLITHVNPGNRTSVKELKWITASRQFSRLWPDSHLHLLSDGGAFMFRVSYPRVYRWGQLESIAYRLGFTPGTITWSKQAYTPTGCAITPSSSVISQELIWYVQFASNGTDFPLLYTLTMEAAAQPRPVDETILGVIEGSAITDYSPRTEGRKRMANVEVMDRGDQYAWLSQMENHQVRVYDRGCLVMTAVVRTPTCTPVRGRWNAKRWSFQLLDRWTILQRDLMWNDPPGDAKELCYYAAQIVANRGFLPSEIKVITSVVTLPVSLSGEKYALLPKQGAERSRWLEELFDKHGLGVSAYFDEAGCFCIVPRDSAANNAHRFSQTLAGATDSRHTCGDIVLTWDFEDFYNLFTVIGGVNPDTGVRYSSRWYDEASVKNSQYRWHIGALREYPPEQDDSLGTQIDCDIACRHLAETYRPRIKASFRTFYHQDLRETNRIFFDGKPVEIVTISGVSRREDRMTLEVKEIF